MQGPFGPLFACDRCAAEDWKREQERKNRGEKRGGTRKIADLPDTQPCHDPEHNPPMHWCPSPGLYVHTCPTCGNQQTIVVQGSIL